MAETKEKQSILNKDEFDGLSDIQISAAEMLQSGKFTQGEIAKIVGVHPVTITRWRKNDKFMAAVKKCQQEKIRQTLAMLNEGSARATEILMELAECDDKRVKMEAVKYILDRNLGKTTSKIIVDDTQKETKDIDIAAEIEAMKNGENPLDIDF